MQITKSSRTDRRSCRLLLLDGLAGAEYLADVADLTEALDERLGDGPGVAGALGDAGVGGKGVAAELDSLHGVADEDTLSIAGAQEDGVDDEQHPRVPHHETPQEDARPQEQLEVGDQVHAGVVVLLDEARDGLGDCRLRRAWSRRHDGRDQVRAQVRQEVERAVHGERQQRGACCTAK